MADLSEAFEGLDDAFDTKFEQKSVVSKTDNSLMCKVEKNNDDDNVIRNTNFVSNEIKSLIETSKSVLDKLDADIKIGSSPRMYEVFSEVTNSITSQLKELRKLHESVELVKIQQNKRKTIDQLHQNDNITLTSNQLLDLINGAKERSEINKIDADFTIDESTILDEED